MSHELTSVRTADTYLDLSQKQHIHITCAHTLQKTKTDLFKSDDSVLGCQTVHKNQNNILKARTHIDIFMQTVEEQNNDKHENAHLHANNLESHEAGADWMISWK
jgi:hypothetical protein